MAEEAAVQGVYLAGERFKKRCQPSIFDVLAQESLMSTLKPALGHLIKVLANFYPNRFSSLHRFFDEAYLTFDFVLQNHCLKTYGSSFAENFYNMKRIVKKTGALPIDPFNRTISIIILVVLPYIHSKLDKLYEAMSTKFESKRDQKTKTNREKICRSFLVVYPWIKSALDMWTFALQFLYVISKCDVHSPYLNFAGVRLETLNPEDLARLGKDVEKLPNDASLLARILRLLSAISGTMFSTFSKLFGFGLLFLQFVNFWYINEQSKEFHNGNNNSLSIPPPPHKMLSEAQILSLEPTKCPICRKVRIKDTVLSVSGFVFCHLCISRFIQKERKCPVTNQVAGPEHLIRLFSFDQTLS